MQKFWGVLLAVFLWTGVSLAMEAKKAEKTCPCPNCPKKGQMMSPEEWQKWHQGMPMPEKMRKYHEEKERHRNQMKKEHEEGNSENSSSQHHEEMEKNYHQKWHKKWH